MIFDYLKYISLYKIVDNKKNPYIIFKFFFIKDKIYINILFIYLI